MYRILMVDDEPSILQLRASFLKEKGCSVDCVNTAQEAKNMINDYPYDCILLDVVLEESSGFTLCRELRGTVATPIIFLSSLVDDENQLEGFLSGGADYITKSAGLSLFWVKIETRIKLSQKGKQILNFGQLSIDLSDRKVFVSGKELILTSLEFDILALLAGESYKVFSLAEIYRRVWGVEQWDQGQTVQVHMSHMRRKLEVAFPRHYFIETVWGKGYHFLPMDDGKS